MNPNTENRAVYAAHSQADLRDVCRALTQILALPLFDFRPENSGEFARAENETCRVEIVRDGEDFRVEFAWRGDAELADLMQQILKNILAATVARSE